MTTDLFTNLSWFSGCFRLTLRYYTHWGAILNQPEIIQSLWSDPRFRKYRSMTYSWVHIIDNVEVTPVDITELIAPSVYVNTDGNVFVADLAEVDSD